MSETDNIENLEEGCLYVYKKGMLQEIESDPDDLMKKIKITPDAFKVASELQNGIRKHMNGYRPDISTICSALIEYSGRSDAAVSVVKAFVIRLYKSIDDVAHP